MDTTTDRLKKCRKCKRSKLNSEFDFRNDTKRYTHECKECRRERVRARDKARYWATPEGARARVKSWRAKLQQEVFAAYGNKCVCCGETQPLFLSIDHIDNDGANHRRELGGTAAVYSYLRREGFPQDKFQLLCHNCNIGKHRLGGVCPHQI